jgi:serine 3-dehydrogenase
MSRISDKVALITGASAGFGAACARACARDGATVVMWARRRERLEALAAELESNHGASARVDVVDVRDRSAVEAAVAALEGDALIPDILINNAGLAAGLDLFHEADHDDWDRMIDTNVKGLLNVSRAVLPLMVKRNRGHVVNIGSIAGHIAYPKGNVYNATKFAVRGLTEAMNLDLVGTDVRVSSVDPGAAETEFSLVRFHGDETKAKSVYDGFEPLHAEDVADAVMYVLGTPAHVNITDLVIMPTAQRNPYVLHRKDA